MLRPHRQPPHMRRPAIDRQIAVLDKGQPVLDLAVKGIDRQCQVRCHHPVAAQPHAAVAFRPQTGLQCAERLPRQPQRTRQADPGIGLYRLAIIRAQGDAGRGVIGQPPRRQEQVAALDCVAAIERGHIGPAIVELGPLPAQLSLQAVRQWQAAMGVDQHQTAARLGIAGQVGGQRHPADPTSRHRHHSVALALDGDADRRRLGRRWRQFDRIDARRLRCTVLGRGQQGKTQGPFQHKAAMIGGNRLRRCGDRERQGCQRHQHPADHRHDATCANWIAAPARLSGS